MKIGLVSRYCILEDIYFDVTNYFAVQKDRDCLKGVIIIESYSEQITSIYSMLAFFWCTLYIQGSILFFLQVISWASMPGQNFTCPLIYHVMHSGIDTI